MTRQRALPLPGRPKPAPVEPFVFIPGPECEPQPDRPVPAWLRLPGDEGPG